MGYPQIGFPRPPQDWLLCPFIPSHLQAPRRSVIPVFEVNWEVGRNSLLRRMHGLPQARHLKPRLGHQSPPPSVSLPVPGMGGAAQGRPQQHCPPEVQEELLYLRLPGGEGMEGRGTAPQTTAEAQGAEFLVCVK